MRILQTSLQTAHLKAEKKFYTQTLGFPLIEESETAFSIKVGWSVLTFISSEIERQYHYCFLIPSNKLEEAMEWMQERTELIDIENGGKIVHSIFMMPAEILSNLLFAMI